MKKEKIVSLEYIEKILKEKNVVYDKGKNTIVAMKESEDNGHRLKVSLIFEKIGKEIFASLDDLGWSDHNFIHVKPSEEIIDEYKRKAFEIHQWN